MAWQQQHMSHSNVTTSGNAGAQPQLHICELASMTATQSSGGMRRDLPHPTCSSEGSVISVLRGECAKNGDAVRVRNSVITASKRLSSLDREMNKMVYASTLMRIIGKSSWKKMGYFTRDIWEDRRG